MTQIDLEEELSELSSAEDFLDYFDVPFEQSIVHINRLHIMQRYHDYLNKAGELLDQATDEDSTRQAYKALLERAYLDFVDSDAQTEKVLKIYKMQGPQETFVSMDELIGV